MTTAALVIALALTGAAQETPQEKKVPKDSVMLVVTGCLKGRVLAVSDVREEDTQTGPIVRGRSFRLAAKGDVMDDIKKAQEMAAQAAQQGGAMGGAAMPDAADMEYAQTAQKIAQSGLPGVATINSIGETGKTAARP